MSSRTNPVHLCSGVYQGSVNSGGAACRIPACRRRKLRGGQCTVRKRRVDSTALPVQCTARDANSTRFRTHPSGPPLVRPPQNSAEDLKECDRLPAHRPLPPSRSSAPSVRTSPTGRRITENLYAAEN